MVQWALGKCESEKWVLKYNVWKDNKRSYIIFVTVFFQSRSDYKKRQEVVQLEETRFVS